MVAGLVGRWSRSGRAPPGRPAARTSARWRPRRGRWQGPQARQRWRPGKVRAVHRRPQGYPFQVPKLARVLTIIQAPVPGSDRATPAKASQHPTAQANRNTALDTRGRSGTFCAHGADRDRPVRLRPKHRVRTPLPGGDAHACARHNHRCPTRSSRRHTRCTDHRGRSHCRRSCRRPAHAAGQYMARSSHSVGLGRCLCRPAHRGGVPARPKTRAGHRGLAAPRRRTRRIPGRRV